MFRIKALRLEWVSLVYFVLFVLAIMSPQIVRHGYFGFPEEQVEEFLIFTFGMAGLATFSAYGRVMERHQHERDAANADRDRMKKELVSSYEYIGAINRQIEALKALATETTFNLVEADRLKKDVFLSLAASAAAFARAPHGVIRIVGLDRLRTIREFTMDGTNIVRVSNRDLRAVHDEGKTYAVLPSEEGGEVLVIPSSRRDLESKAFLIISRPSGGAEPDYGLLGVYANQAEVLYRAFARQDAEE